MKNLLYGAFLVLMGGILGGLVYFWQHQTQPELVVPLAQVPASPSPMTSFSLENPPRESLKGMITVMNDDVWWESRVATEPAKLTQKIGLQQGEILIASDSGEVTAEFPNAVNFTLAPKTKVEIVQTLPANVVFNHSAGTATYQAFGTVPVSVRSLRLLTTLAEGIATFSIDEETNYIIVLVESGEVTLAYNNSDFTSQLVTLSAKQRFVFDNDNRRGFVE